MRVQFIQSVCFRGQDMRRGQEIDCPENLARALEFRKLARIVTNPAKVAPVAPVPVPAPEPAPVVAVCEPDPVQTPVPAPVPTPAPPPVPEPPPDPKKPQRARRSRGKKVA